MKYAFRRLLAGIVIVPLIAVAYFVLYVGLVAWGATPNATPSEVWANGLVAGVIATLVFAGSALVKAGK